jgi:uncharacterized membrane protein
VRQIKSILMARAVVLGLGVNEARNHSALEPFALAPTRGAPTKDCPLADPSPPPVLPGHVEETIRSIARLHAEHHGAASTPQRVIDRLTGLVGQPSFIGALLGAIAAWIGLNLLAAALGHRPVDPPPFVWLNGAVSLISLMMVVLILGSQRHEEQIAQHRELLTLELAILSEQKTAKVIQLLEEVRRDNPLIHDRVDREADAMARPADPQSVLDAIKETHVVAADTLRARR